MLDIAGNLSEWVIHTRLETCQNQFGFREGRSTINAIDWVETLVSDAIITSSCTKRMCAIVALYVRPYGMLLTQRDSTTLCWL